MSRKLPHTTVAAVIEKDSRFLLVEEISSGSRVFNQPAGHMEAGETLIEAVIREVQEETAWQVQPSGVLGIDTYNAPNGVTYVRVCFVAKALADTQLPLDDDIIAAHWLSFEEVSTLENAGLLRSPLVFKAIERYRQNVIYPLDIIGACS